MSFVRSQQEGPVLTLTLDRPEALNALNAQVLDDLSAELDRVDLHSVRCLIFTGAGEKAFAAGADIAAMGAMTPEAAAAFSRRGNQVFRRIETFPLPTIAAVNGYALGGGCELAMACDIRLCSENALFGQSEVTLGITPGFGGTQRLMRLVGMGKAKELIFSARNVKAAEALQMGLVNGVYPTDELLPAAEKLAAKIAKNAPIAVRACKAAMNEGVDLPMDQAIDAEVREFSACFETEDQKRGMAGFLNKQRNIQFENK
ncbi:MAG: enoyl-CoA hydratase/isomerase family protein [Clostridia bacterium]|nr:enoyl-CoA hydratase/isomerase family protein [Clostridia bacterium]